MISGTRELFKKYSLNTYTRTGPVFIKGKGSWLWDSQCKRYLDLFPGWGVSILGHCHPRIVKIINEQSKRLIHLPNNLFFREQVDLAREIVKSSFPSKVFFANSGAEAVEGAIKVSRIYGMAKKRYEIIVMKDSFHGRTFGALSATGQKKYKDPFKPVLQSFKEARLNDLSSVKKKTTDKTVAVLLELIQGEGGVNVASKEFITDLYNYCKMRSLLFIVDEVQTGMGRTGKLFSYQYYSIKPDIMLLSKGLGAGIPISAMVVSEDIAGLMKPGMHASTFGGSPFVCRVAKEVFSVIKEERILANVNKMSGYLFNSLRKLKEKFPEIKGLRGMGLMAGIELNFKAYHFVAGALKRGLIINATHENIIRIMPALNVTLKELELGIKIIESVLRRK
ncbi:MAG: aspartate aminotransferase family protein [Candidatus Omnitrophota bacterium]